jgi:RHS repeat-associated protein
MKGALRLGGRGVRALAFALAAATLMLAAQAVQAQGNSPTVSVAVTTPANGAVITVPGAVPLAATASINRANWAILEVDFYSGSTLIGKATGAPYGITWQSVPAGTYTITAQAIATNPGQAKQDPGTPNMPTWTGVSAPVSFRVNAPPAVSLAAPAANSVFNAPADVTVTANAADSDGTVAKVDFYAGNALIGTATGAPYSVTWANPAPGTYSLTAVATDNDGASTRSAPVAMRVNALPSVTLASPANNASYTAPASITLTANALDSDGTIAKVEFLQGTSVLATVTVAPYTFAWTNVAQGTYVLSARATDDQGAATTSTEVTVTVKPAAGTLYFIHPDHLNTPRLIADAAGTTVWRWDQQEPFGNDVPNGDPNATGATFDFPLRFPGQYFDRETNLAYNYFRDYDPSIGRYVESDPVGLKAGINTYAYVGQDPLGGVDPLGLVKVHGNWCGPDWTGGYKKEWNQLTPNEQQLAKLPIGPIDVSCMKHDKCYASCRAGSPCNPDARSTCFADCDLTLYAEVYSQGFTGYAVGTAMAREGKRDPGPNAANCPNCPKQ